ncbi:MmgE/PrpD family protein [Actinomadura madurae]|uniref:MmgE/PrpD family protein n=1 Tax=Actinomadura madurae TaxID=1993 RepID=UPI00399B62ED
MTGELALERFARELMSSRERRPGPSARRMAHRCLSDALACAAAGVLTPAYERARAAAGQLFGAGDATATIWFDAVPAPALQAAFLNSVAVSAHDLDDGHRAAAGHPGEAVVPAVIAEAESQGLPDVDVLHAIVVGYEAGVRIAAARDTSALTTLATGRWAGFAAAAVSCWIAGDDPGTAAAALAHAGSLSPQLIAPDPRRVDGLKEATPWGVTAGLAAARLARAGIPAPTYLLEAHPDFRPERLGAVRVDHEAAILGTYFKRYSCCRWIHPVIDGLSAIRARRKLRIDTVEQIEILTFGRSLTLSNVVRPQTTEEAHYSFPFCAALSLVRGPSALLPISASSLHDAQVIELADRVVVRADPDLERSFPANTPAIVRVYAGDEVHEKRMDTARGDPGLPFRPQTLRAKHRRLLSHLPSGATAVADALNTAGKTDLGALTTALRATNHNDEGLPGGDLY